MTTATLVEAHVAHACPVTNLYACDDGRHLLVTVRENDYLAGIFEGLNGITMPSATQHVTSSVEVFLADERGQIIDYDGDPANGLTPILSTDSSSFAMTIVPDLHTHADALAALDITIAPEEPLMPNVTFTIDDTIAGVGPKKLSFFPREAFATPAGGLVPNDGPKPIKDKSYARGTIHTESLPEGPWWVAGLSPEYIPIDVGPAGGNLKDLIVWGVPQNTPATTLAQAVATWLEANGDTQVTAPLVEQVLSNPSPGTQAVLGERVADALAEDETVANAAAAAVTTNIAGRDLVQRADPGIPQSKTLSDQYLTALLGLRDELVWGVKSDGAVQIPIAELAGGRTMQIPAEGLSWAALTDAAGRIGELCLDNAGQVPAWVLARWAARMGLTGSDPATTTWPIDIVIVAGQSNATQRSSLAATIENSAESVVEWTGSGFTPASGVPWLGSGFAREYAGLHGRPRRRRVGLVKAALGSTGFSSTDPGTWDRTVTTGATAYLYPEMIAKAQAALAAAPAGSQIVAMLWSQGEQDRSMSSAAYTAKLDDLIAQTRIDLAIPDLPVIIGSLTPEIIKTGGAGGAVINGALEDTPRRVTRTAFVPGPASMAEPDTGIHWTPQGQTLRGAAMARAGLDTARLNLATSAPMPPQNLRVTRSGTEVVVEWDHPATRITSYTIEVSTDLGAVWTAMTLDRPTVHKVTGSVAVGTPVWVRGTGTNEVGTSMISGEVHA